MDEAEQAAQEWLDTYGIPDSVEAVADLIRTHNAAGRKAGEAAMRERCERIARSAQASESVPGMIQAMLQGQAEWIADAIAKEGDRG